METFCSVEVMPAKTLKMVFLRCLGQGRHKPVVRPKTVDWVECLLLKLLTLHVGIDRPADIPSLQV